MKLSEAARKGIELHPDWGKTTGMYFRSVKKKNACACILGYALLGICGDSITEESETNWAIETLDNIFDDVRDTAQPLIRKYGELESENVCAYALATHLNDHTDLTIPEIIEELETIGL